MRFQTIKLTRSFNSFYSQHPVQAEETAVKEQGTPTPASPLATDAKEDQTHSQNQALLPRLQLLASEHQNLQAQFRRSQESEREASEKVQK